MRRFSGLMVCRQEVMAKTMESTSENVIKQKREGCRTERQTGGDHERVKGNKSPSNNEKKKESDVSNRRENVEDKGSTKAPAVSHAKEL